MATILAGEIPLGGIHVAVVHASESSTPQGTIRQGEVERGRALFNGKGICFYCHGIDGAPDQLPHLSSDTTKIIERLDPKPSDLRNPRSLKLKTDGERFKAMREGHSGTAMLPDRTLTDKDIFDLLAYLSMLRDE